MYNGMDLGGLEIYFQYKPTVEVATQNNEFLHCSRYSIISIYGNLRNGPEMFKGELEQKPKINKLMFLP